MLKITAKARYLALAAALLLILETAVDSPEAWARPGEYQRQEQQAISQARAASIVKRRYGGKVLKVQRRQSGKNLVYRVKLLQDSGRVRQVVVNANTGAIVSGK